ncbi:MAG: type II secretion system major pseudopilin GspG, partial [Phycisphaerae bacterium]|nr:type II secretion system major pseudopilin GspG [Phycisphaerae bacterium]
TIERNRTLKKQLRTRSGFTLIEVLLVMVILAMLAGVAIVMFSGTEEGAKIDTTKLKLTEIEKALGLYNMHVKHYPTEEEGGLEALRKKPSDEDAAKKWRGPYLTEKPKDAWDKPFHYEPVDSESTENIGKPYKLWSEGPDKQSETDDDIRSWSEEDTE